MHQFERQGIFILLCLFSFLFSYCQSNQPIKIGLVGGLTGKSSELAVSGRNGAILAVEEINLAGGIHGTPIQLVIRDDRDTPDGAIEAVKELQREKIPVIIGHYTSGATIGSFDYVNEKKILMISPTVSSSRFSNLDDYFFRIMPHNSFQGKILAQTAVSKKIKTIAAIYEETNKVYGQELYKHFSENYKKLGGKIIFLRSFVSGPNSDIFQLAKDAAASNPDGVLVIAGGIDTAIFCQKLSQLHSSLKVLTGGWCMTNDFIQYGGNSLGRVLITSDFSVGENKNEAYFLFKKNYQKRFGIMPTFSSANSYDIVQMIYQMLKKIPEPNSDNLRQFLKQNKKFPGLQGEIKINDTGDTERPHYIYQIKGDLFVKVEN